MTFVFGCRDLGPLAGVVYLPPGAGAPQASISPVGARLTDTFTLDQMYVRHNTPNDLDVDVTYDVLINGESSGLQITLSSSESDGTDLIHTADISPGDLLTLRVVKENDMLVSALDSVVSMKLK